MNPAFARIAKSLRRPTRGQAVVGVLVGVLAFTTVAQVRANSENDVYAGMRQADLVQALNGLQAASNRAQLEINSLSRTRNSLRNSTHRHTTALSQARKELATLGILAGTMPAHGPGIVITVDIKRGHYTVNHLLDGIEELRDAGAEAIEMNGQVRVVARTSFTDSSRGIVVDGHLLAPPYRLAVIGNPDTLARALDFPGGFKDDVNVDGGTTHVVKRENVHIDVVRSLVQPQYASPAPGQ